MSCKPEATEDSKPLLLSRDGVEAEYGIGRRFLELSAYRGDGPPMVKISRRCVRYRRSDIETWLRERTVG